MIYYIVAFLLATLHCETNAATSTITNIQDPKASVVNVPTITNVGVSITHSPISNKEEWEKIVGSSEADLSKLSEQLKMDLIAPLPEINAKDLEALAKKGHNEVSHVEGPCTAANIEIIHGHTHLEGDQPLLLIRGEYRNGAFEFQYSRPGEEHRKGKTVKIRATNLAINDHVKDLALGRFLQNYINGLTSVPVSHVVTEQAAPQTKTIIVHDQAPPPPPVVYASPPVVYSSPSVVYAPAPVYVAPREEVIIGIGGPWGYGHRHWR